LRQLLGADAALIGNAPTIDPAALPGRPLLLVLVVHLVSRVHNPWCRRVR
jgi:hypothetical protein